MAEQRAGALAGRAMFTLIGAAGLVVGAFLPWVRGIEGNRLALSALVRRPFVTEPNQLMTVGFVCVLLGLLAVVGLATSGWLTRLAGALGIHYQTVGYLERGEYSPSLFLALRIAEYFEVPVEVIFSITPFPRVWSSTA